MRRKSEIKFCELYYKANTDTETEIMRGIRNSISLHKFATSPKNRTGNVAKRVSSV